MSLDNHFIICGFGRSGSTMFHHMLSTTVHDVKFYQKEIPAMKVADHPNPKLTKRPRDCFLRDKIEKVCRNPVFIYMVRDPRDVLCSIHSHSEGNYKFDWDKGLGTARNRKDPLSGHLTGRITEGVLDYCREISKWPESSWIRYEDLLLNPRKVQLICAERYGFTMTGLFQDFYLRHMPQTYIHPLNGVRPIDTNNIGKWRQHKDRIADQFGKCPELFDWVKFYGYENDNKWFEEIV